MADQDWLDRQPSGGWAAGRRRRHKSGLPNAANARDDVVVEDYRRTERISRGVIGENSGDLDVDRTELLRRRAATRTALADE